MRTGKNSIEAALRLLLNVFIFVFFLPTLATIAIVAYVFSSPGFVGAEGGFTGHSYSALCVLAMAVTVGVLVRMRARRGASSGGGAAAAGAATTAVATAALLVLLAMGAVWIFISALSGGVCNPRC